MDATAWATFWVFLALLVLVGLMFYLGVPGKIIGALDARGEKIRQELADAARLRDEAKALLAEYQRRRGEAVAEAEAIIDQARREADVMAQEARDRLEDYVTRRTKAVEQRIAQAESQAVTEVRSRAVDVATDAASRILAEKADGQARRSLIDQSIAAIRSNLN
jgi:F-type H+-transporting ATPase subunit b